MFWQIGKIPQGQNIYTISKNSQLGTHLLIFIYTSFEHRDFLQFLSLPLNDVTKYVTNQCLFEHWLKLSLKKLFSGAALQTVS